MDNKPVPQLYWEAFVTHINGNAQKSWPSQKDFLKGKIKTQNTEKIDLPLTF